MEEKYKQEPSNCIKVVLFGPESTGKTTLSRQLARYYNSVWVPEYARAYLQNKWNNERKICDSDDLLPIAEGQMRLENDLTKIEFHNELDEVEVCSDETKINKLLDWIESKNFNRDRIKNQILKVNPELELK